MFRLSIECTKDIDAINITFSDGKMATVSTQEPVDWVPPISQHANPDEHGNIEKPEIPGTDNRDVKVASNLQNLDI